MFEAPKKEKCVYNTCYPYSGGNTSRTDNLRNARCRVDNMSATNRAKSQTSLSSCLIWVTNTAKSAAMVMRSREERGRNVKWCCGNNRRASRNRFREAEWSLQSKTLCHSESRIRSLSRFQQNKQHTFLSDSRIPGKLPQRGWCALTLAKSLMPLRNRNIPCNKSCPIESGDGKIAVNCQSAINCHPNQFQ